MQYNLPKSINLQIYPQVEYMKYKNYFPSHYKGNQKKEDKILSKENIIQQQEAFHDSRLDKGWNAESKNNSAASSQRKSDHNTAKSLEEIQPNELNLINNSDVLWKHLREQQKQLEEYKFRMRQIIGIQDDSDNEEDQNNFSKFPHLKILKSKIKQNNQNLLALNALAQSPQKQKDFLQILKQIQILPVKNIDILDQSKFQNDSVNKSCNKNYKEQIQNHGISGKKVQNFNFINKNQKNIKQVLNEGLQIENFKQKQQKNEKDSLNKSVDDRILHLQGQKLIQSSFQKFDLENIKNFMQYTTENLETETDLNQLSFRIDNQKISQELNLFKQSIVSQKKDLTSPILQNKKKDNKHFLEMENKLQSSNKKEDQVQSALLNPLYLQREITELQKQNAQDHKIEIKKDQNKRIPVRTQSNENQNAEAEDIHSLKGEEDVIIIVTNQSENFNLQNNSDNANKISRGTLEEIFQKNSSAQLISQNINEKSSFSHNPLQSKNENQKELDININQQQSTENKKMLENRKSTQNFPSRILSSKQENLNVKSQQKQRRHSSNNQSMQTMQKNATSLSPPISPNFPIQIMARNQQIPTFYGMYPMINMDNFPSLKNQMLKNDDQNEFIIYQTNESINIYSQKQNMTKKQTQKLQLPSLNHDISNSLSPLSNQKSKSKITNQNSQKKFNLEKILSSQSQLNGQIKDPFSSQKIKEDEVKSNYIINLDDQQNAFYDQNLQNFANNFKIVNHYQQAQLAQLFELHQWAKMQFQFQQLQNQEANPNQFQNEDKNMISDNKNEKSNISQPEDLKTQSIINMNQFPDKEFPFIKLTNLKGKSLKSKQEIKQKQSGKLNNIIVQGNHFGNTSPFNYNDSQQSSFFKKNIFSQNRTTKSKILQKQNIPNKKDNKKTEQKKRVYKLIEDINNQSECISNNNFSNENDIFLSSKYKNQDNDANKTFLSINQKLEIQEQKSLNTSIELSTKQTNQMQKSQSQLEKNFNLQQDFNMVKKYQYKNNGTKQKIVFNDFEEFSQKEINKRKIVHQRMPSKEDMNINEQVQSDRSSHTKSQKSKSNRNRFQFQNEHASQSKLISERTSSSNGNRIPKLKLHQIDVFQREQLSKEEKQINGIIKSIYEQGNQFNLDQLQTTLRNLDQLTLQGLQIQYEQLKKQQGKKKMKLNAYLNSQMYQSENNKVQKDDVIVGLGKPTFESNKIVNENKFVLYDRFKICRNKQQQKSSQAFFTDSTQNEQSVFQDLLILPNLSQTQNQFIPKRAVSQIEKNSSVNKQKILQMNFQFQKTSRNFENTQNTFFQKIDILSSKDSPQPKNSTNKKYFNSSQRVFNSSIFKKTFPKLEQQAKEKDEIKIYQNKQIQKIEINELKNTDEKTSEKSNKEISLFSSSQLIKSICNTNEDEQFSTIKSNQEKKQKLEQILKELKSLKQNPKAITPQQFMKDYQINQEQKIDYKIENNVSQRQIPEKSLNISSINPQLSRNLDLINLYGNEISQNNNVQQFLQKVIFQKCDLLRNQQDQSFIKIRKKPKQDFDIKELKSELQKENKKQKITQSILDHSYNQILKLKKMRKLELQKEMNEKMSLIENSNIIIDQIKKNEQIIQNNQQILAVYITDQDLSETKKADRKTEYQQSAQKLKQPSFSIYNEQIDQTNILKLKNLQESKKKSQMLKQNPSLNIISQGSYHKMEETPRQLQNKHNYQKDLHDDKQSKYGLRLQKVLEGDLIGII